MMYQVDNKAVAVCCPLCAARTISIAQESVVADSYYCANCRAYFSVTAAFPPPTYTLTSTTDPTEGTGRDWAARAEEGSRE